MLASAKATASSPLEVCAWRDEDDRTEYPADPAVRYGSGPRPYLDGGLCTSELWTKAAELASGDVLMLCADDVIFRTRGWDERVQDAFISVSDRIVMVYADDGGRRKAPVLPFVSREWIEATGEFTPPGWQGWMSDQWIWQLAAELGRVVFLPDVRIAHLQRRGSDETYRDGERAREAAGGLDGMIARFYSPEMMARREEQVARLRAAMIEGVDLVPAVLPPWYVDALARA
jgi:hypothetical protein